MQNYPFWGIGPQIYYYDQQLSIMQMNSILAASRPQYFQCPFFDSNLLIRTPAEEIVERDFFTGSLVQDRSQIGQTQKKVKVQSFQKNHVEKFIERESPSKAHKQKQGCFGAVTQAKQQSCIREVQIQTIRKNSLVQIAHEKQSKVFPVKEKPFSPPKQKNYSAKNYLFNGRTYQLSVVMELTKELIIFILDKESLGPEMMDSIKSQIAEQVRKTLGKSKEVVNQFLDDLIRIISSKFMKFRKTKQQMIKYVFRKIFNAKNKPKQVSQLKWRIAQRMHEQNSKSFKSMNVKYVEKQFQSPIFVELFQIFLENFDQNYEVENEERIDRLNTIVASALLVQDLSQLKTERKMPWNRNIRNSISSMFSELQQIQKKIKYPQDAMESLIRQFKKAHAVQYNTFKQDKFQSRGFKFN